MTTDRAPAADRELVAHAEAWAALGRVDPMWAILTRPARRGRRWTETEFYATGTEEVAALLAVAARLGRPSTFGTALDFGCGVGRLTLPLADRFASVLGVDISGPMIEGARRAAVDRANVTFQTLGPAGAVPAPDRSFDLVLSMYVLQHLPSPAAVVRHLIELARLVRDGGLLVVQLPAPIPLRHRLQPRRRAYTLLRRLGLGERLLFDGLGLSPMRLIGVPQPEVRDVLTGAGLEILDVRTDVLTSTSIDSFTYYATPQRAPRPNRMGR